MKRLFLVLCLILFIPVAVFSAQKTPVAGETFGKHVEDWNDNFDELYGNYLDKGQFYVVDVAQADQMADTGDSLYSILLDNGTVKKYTVYLSHSTASTNTDYVCSTTRDLSAYTNVTLKPQWGARLKDDGSNATITWGGKIDALPGQQMFDWGTGSGSITYRDGQHVYASWHGDIMQALDDIDSTSDITLENDVPVTLTADIVVGSNITLKVEPENAIGGIYDITIYGSIIAGEYQIFVGSGTVTYPSRIGISYSSEWQGVFPDVSDTDSIETVLSLERETTGTAESGLGGGVYFALEDAGGGPLSGAGGIAAIVEDPATGVRDCGLIFGTRSGGTNTWPEAGYEKVRITSNGEVGIGTETPGELLEVVGDVLCEGLQVVAPAAQPGTVSIYGFGANTELQIRQYADSVSDIDFEAWKAYGTLDTPTTVPTDAEVLSMIARAHDGTDFEVVGEVKIDVDGVVAAGATGGRLRLMTTSGAGVRTTRLYINKSGLVGIGTGDVAPTEAIELVGVSGTATVDPVTIKIRTTSSGGDWNLADPWGVIDFHNNDASGTIGNGVRARIGAVAQTVGGADTALIFQTSATGDATPVTQAIIDEDGNAWFKLDVSALTFTDRTPFYEGDALAEISNIKGEDGEIDHSTLPEFVRKQKTTIKRGIKEIEELRDIGAMVSILTVAIQQLTIKVEALEEKVK